MSDESEVEINGTYACPMAVAAVRDTKTKRKKAFEIGSNKVWVVLF